MTCAAHYILYNYEKKNEMDGACSTYGGMRCAYSVLVGKSQAKTPLRRPSRSWEDSVKLGPPEVSWKVRD
jgi:hypothetical protein